MAVKALDKSGRTERIRLSIGARSKEIKDTIKFTMKTTISDILINLTPQFHHGQDF